MAKVLQEKFRNANIINYNMLNSSFPTVAQTNTAMVDVPGWSISLATNKIYLIEVLGTYQTDAATTGISIGVILSAGSAVINGFIAAGVSGGTVASELKTPLKAISIMSVAGSFLKTTSVSSAHIPLHIHLRAIVHCTAAGDLKIQWGTEVSNSLAQLDTDSIFLVTQLN